MMETSVFYYHCSEFAPIPYTVVFALNSAKLWPFLRFDHRWYLYEDLDISVIGLS